jgi:hypothetical protein
MSSPIPWANLSPAQRESQLVGLVDELRTQVQQLQQQQSRLQEQIQEQEDDTDGRTKPRPVLPGVTKFNGRSQEWDVWETSIRAKLKIDGDAIGSDEAQFFYVYSSVDAKVQSLILPFIRKAQAKRSWEPKQLVLHLGRLFDDPQKIKKAGQRLIKLRQEDTSGVVSFLPRFEKVLFEAGADEWPDDAKITTLVGSLNKFTRQRVNAQIDLPTSYDDFVKMLQNLGNQFGPSYGVDNNDSSRRTGKSGEMDWIKTAVVRKGRADWVSEEQRQERYQMGKCVRCGRAGHFVDKCNLHPAINPRSRSPSVDRSDRAGVNAVARIAPRTKTTARRTGKVARVEASSDTWESDVTEDYF